MTIEYNLRFGDSRLTITQRIEGDSGSESSGDTSQLTQNILPASFQEAVAAKKARALAGSGPNDPIKGGDGGPDDPIKGGGPNDPIKGGFTPGSAPLTIFGPFIFLCPRSSDSTSGVSHE